MGKIKLLSEEVINKIAAGEVVERPASVVKELVENAIDAQADVITVTLEESGMTEIIVEDNGMGMDKEDAVHALQRHATSKLSNADDLFAIRTLGFRGEALASIAAVAKVELLTKRIQDVIGMSIRVEAGEIKEPRETACNPGTKISVRDLFYNVPARKKHLKQAATELRAVIDIITRYALLYNTISFILIHGQKRILHAPATTEKRYRVASVYGPALAEQLIPVDYYWNDVHVSGFIAKPTATRNDKAMQTLFVNKRLVKNYVLTQAVYKGYHTLLHLDKHPSFIIHIELAPEKIDVNVHPQKTEIRIDKEQDLFMGIMQAIKFALETSPLVPQIIEEKHNEAIAFKQFQTTEEKQTLLAPNVTAEKIEQQVTEKVSSLRLLGRVHNLFYLAENELGLVIIDQHAAHERVLYEKFKQQLEQNAVKKQELLQPELLELAAIEASVVEENKIIFERLGFNVEPFGNTSFLLRTIPSVLGRQLKKEVFFDVLGGLTEIETRVEAEREDKIMRTACRAAVKANDVVEVTEMYDIMLALQRCENPFTCPHGRPTMIQFTIPELERKFKRVT